MLRKVSLKDASAIAEIYNHYVHETIITFEETEVNATEIENRIQAITAKYPWIVFEENGEILGYAYGCEWRTRSAYRFTAESAVYLRHDLSQKGIGSTLYQELLLQLKNQGIHAVMGVIGLPNEPSIKLHEKFGFEKVAHFPQVGFKFQQWVDVGYWQLTF